MGFFDKLKEDVGVAESEKPEKKPEKKPEDKPQKQLAKKKSGDGSAAKRTQKPRPEKPEKIETEPEAVVPPKKEKEEFRSGGELAIDVYENDGDFVIQSTIAGVKAEDLNITIEDDMVTITGSRQRQTEGTGQKYYYQECYWGSFSRQIILPEEVDGSKTEAKIKEGVLTLIIPKLKNVQRKKIAIRQEE